VFNNEWLYIFCGLVDVDEMASLIERLHIASSSDPKELLEPDKMEWETVNIIEADKGLLTPRKDCGAA